MTKDLCSAVVWRRQDEVEGEVEGGKLKGKRTTFIWRTGPGLDTKISEVKTAYIPLFILTFTAGQVAQAF